MRKNKKNQDYHLLQSKQLRLHLFSIMLGSYLSKRAVNYPIIGTPEKHIFKKRKKSVRYFSFLILREQ